MTTSEVADQLIAMCREGKFVGAVEALYADDVVSVEAAGFGGMPREMRGKEAVKRKNAKWFESNVMHSATVTGPFVSPERFAVVYTFERTNKASGERGQLSEVAVYTVVDGKIAHEEFLYAAKI